MRDIKFRFWEKQIERMLNPDTVQTLCFKNNLDKKLINDLVFMQYTGLKDKNGVEIYEGDIVKFCHEDYFDYENNTFCEDSDENEIGQICWGGTYPAFDIFSLVNKNVTVHDCEYNIFSCECYLIEIIGNIYENKELLK